MLTALPAYAELMSAARSLERASLAALLADADRSRRLVFRAGELTLDASRQRVDHAVMAQLVALAGQAHLPQKIAALFAGERVNISEDRPVLHMMQRSADTLSDPDFARLAGFADQVRSSPVTAVINIGIGGSDLGPAMVSAALANHGDGPKLHYVSNVDPSHLHDVLLQCDPATTLVIVTSKTFTTAETMRNAGLARDWLASVGRQQESLAGVTAVPEKAAEWGIAPTQIFDFDEGVGGRYSLWSAVGLPVMIDVGPEKFAAMLAGAALMDEHFRTAPLAQNLPVIMGLLRVWNRNFLGYATHGIMPYDQRLALVPAWAQQLEMESNGKSVSRDGSPLHIATTPVIWGAAGTGCQHSFFQALHQGSDIVPLDIMVPLAPAGISLAGDWAQSHKILVANALAQAEALAIGSPNSEEPHRHFAGGRPSSLISWPSTTPHVLGQLLALYEHVTVVSGFIWDVNSFDQWGVELGKVMALQFSAVLAGGSPADDLSATAADLLAEIMTNTPDSG
ncbi:MAG: glucose-6-phosphate isomerase [Candidatus Puniceispirillaceae bacterium]